MSCRPLGFCRRCGWRACWRSSARAWRRPGAGPPVPLFGLMTQRARRRHRRSRGSIRRKILLTFGALLLVIVLAGGAVAAWVYSVAEGVRLPDRRVVPEVVVGPAGVLVVEELPPPAVSRHRGPYWEVRLAIGRWIPIENPVERAARDAARLKNWLRSEGEDLSPRMYAAVIADGHEVERTNEVAVLTRDQIPAFLAAMPPINHMTRERRARITNLLRQSL